uniref:Uncharacterized protein n=1 Tax=Zooxanthella nutricula TaxID=1333877 RepID=A0A7S2VI29_9DINO
MDTMLLHTQWGRRAPFLMALVPPRYLPHFRELVRYHQVQQWGFWAADVLSMSMAARAAWHWRQFVPSTNWLRASFALSFVPPFMLLLIIPFRDGAEVAPIMRQMCHDTSRTLSEHNLTSFQEKLKVMAKRTIVQTADQVKNAMEIDCDHFSPVEWVPQLIHHIEIEGWREQDDGTCPQIQRLNDLREEDSSARFIPSVEHCPSECQNCTKACADWLVPLGTMAGLYGADALPKMLGHSFTSLGSATSCQHCFSENNGLKCAWRCEGIRMALSMRSLFTDGEPWRPKCLTQESVREMRLWGDVLAQPAYWKMLLGTAYGLRSLRWLMPLASSVMLGASYGSRIARSAIPFSRIPALVNAAAAVFSLPFIFLMAVLIQNICGGPLTLLGILLTIVFIVASLQPGPMEVDRLHDFWMDKGRYYYVKYGALSGATLCFATSMLTDELASAWFNLLQEKGMLPTLEDLAAVRLDNFWVLGRFLLTLAGTSQISAVFFADGSVSLIHRFHEGEARDAADVKSRRNKLLADIGTAVSGVPAGDASLAEAGRTKPEARRAFAVCGCKALGGSRA